MPSNEEAWSLALEDLGVVLAQSVALNVLTRMSESDEPRCLSLRPIPASIQRVAVYETRMVRSVFASCDH